MSRFLTAALYKFVDLPDFADLQAPLLALCRQHQVKGTLLLAEEGINGTIAGLAQDVHAVLEWLRSDPRLADLEHKEAWADEAPFHRLKVRLKAEIVTMHVPGLNPARMAGTYVKPEAWNALLEERLGIRPANDVEGCLQDIHWAVGHFGYFPSYAIGAVIAGQINEALRAALPALDEQLAVGRFDGVLGWLRDNVYVLGARLPVQELMKEATGRPLTATPYLRYLETKYLAS